MSAAHADAIHRGGRDVRTLAHGGGIVRKSPNLLKIKSGRIFAGKRGLPANFCSEGTEELALRADFKLERQGAILPIPIDRAAQSLFE
jgi:hypothetical protein